MPKQLTPTEIENMFRERGKEILKRDLADIPLDAKFGELKVSSVDVMEIIGAMEDDLDMELPDSALARVESVKDLVQLFVDQQPS